MNLKKYFHRLATVAIAGFSLFSTQSAESAYFCQCWPGDLFGWGYLDLTNGYRHDKMTCDIQGFVPDNTLLFTDTLKITDIQLYQIGVKGKWTFCNVLLYVEGDWGCGNFGKYNETTSTPAGNSSTLKACLHDCQVGDFDIGTGYLFWTPWYVGLGPTAGWSYHHQRIKTKDSKINDISVGFFDDLKYREYWQGPWVGADVVFEYCQFTLNASYEYHWAHWHASWDLKHPDNRRLGFSDRRKSDNAWGNVVYFDAMWNFCYYWNVGVGFKYQNWRATNGNEHPAAGSFAKVGQPANEFDKVKKATWESWDVTFDIGYTF